MRTNYKRYVKKTLQRFEPKNRRLSLWWFKNSIGEKVYLVEYNNNYGGEPHKWEIEGKLIEHPITAEWLYDSQNNGDRYINKPTP